MKSVQVAVQGLGHIKADIPCQDKTYALEAKGVASIALCDGAGSARLSHFGAAAVSEGLCQLMSESFDEFYSDEDGVRVKAKLQEHALKALNAQAKAHKCELKDLSCTLLLVAVKADAFMLAHVGDGVIGYMKNSELKTASEPMNGEFANETVFINSKMALKTMELKKGKLGDIEGFVLMSDGSETSLYNSAQQTLAPAVKRFMRNASYMHKGFYESRLTQSFKELIRTKTSDDCSMVIMMMDKAYYELGIDERLGIFRLKRGENKTLKKFENILELLEQPCSLSTLASKLYLKQKHANKALLRLRQLGFVGKKDELYKSFFLF